MLLLVVLPEKGSFSLDGATGIWKVKMKEEDSVQLGRTKRNNEVDEFNLNEQADNGDALTRSEEYRWVEGY